MSEAAWVSVAQFLPAQSVQAAIEHERTLAMGHVLAMPEADTREVIAAWAAWSVTHMPPMDWGEVRSAVIRRGNGLEWRPGVEPTTTKRPHPPR